MKKVLACFALWLLILSVALSTSETIAAEIDKLLSPISKKPAGEIIKVHTAWSLDRVHPGSHVILAVIFDIAKDFHINADKSQIIPVKDLNLYPTQVQMIKVPEGITAESPRFPKAQQLKVEYADQGITVFTGRTVIYLPMKIDEIVKSGPLHFKVQIDYQACDAQTCFFPQKAVIKKSIEVVESGIELEEINKELFEGYKTARRSRTLLSTSTATKCCGRGTTAWNWISHIATFAHSKTG